MSWEDRFLAPRWRVPVPARDDGGRAVVTGNPDGTWEIFSWDGRGAPVAATSRAQGTSLGAIDVTGAQVWWFADTAGDEFGSWRRQPFGSGPGADEEAIPGVPAGYPGGLELGSDGVVVVGTSDPGGSKLYWVAPGESPRLLYHHAESASVAALRRDNGLVVIEHSEHRDSRHPALRALRPDGEVVAELWDGPGRGLSAVEFSASTGDVLVVHERAGREELLLWSPERQSVRELAIELPGELVARFTPEGDALVVVCEHDARATAWRYHPSSGRLDRLGPPGGTIGSVEPRPGGTVWLGWSSAAQPPQVLADPGDAPLLAPAGLVAPTSVPVTDVRAAGPGGTVHALLSLPPGAGPHPTVVLVHGGPTWHDSDAFDPGVAAFVDAGFAVARVNYRGSTGYGSGWRDAIEAAPGLVELEDVAAVHDQLVADGVADPRRSVLAGASWGGFLTLLGLGRQPERWALGLAAVPVADYVAAYEDEMDALQAFDRALFGGAPDQVPERYQQASPLSYIDQVTAPVLVLAGANDPRCPLRQIENYLAALRERGAVHEVYRFDAGHGSLVVEERIRQMRAQLDFLSRRLPG